MRAHYENVLGAHSHSIGRARQLFSEKELVGCDSGVCSRSRTILHINSLVGWFVGRTEEFGVDIIDAAGRVKEITARGCSDSKRRPLVDNELVVDPQPHAVLYCNFIPLEVALRRRSFLHSVKTNHEILSSAGEFSSTVALT